MKIDSFFLKNGIPEEPYAHLKSERFKVIRGAMCLLREPYEMMFHAVFHPKGMEEIYPKIGLVVRLSRIGEGILAGRLTCVREREFLHSQQFNYGEDWGQSASSQTENKRRNTMKSSTNDQVEGKFHKVKGKIKEIAGKVSENPGLEAEGKDEREPVKFRKRSARSRKSWGSKSAARIIASSHL
ncbi:CsbD family protein [Candidatus Kuenenia stuttgartiensis]|uniref:CsbD family protein n=1 Tax=Kuenenia stuttgartiensis TaxID=174633 RepID=UPI001B8CF764|nr:CsbD family protein [Candidatus Kuenenia stuttgartiensis]